MPEEELDRLLALTGLPAPPEYRAYLQTFGHAAAAFLYREAYARLRQPRLTHHRTLRADAGVGAPRSEGAAARRVDRFLELVHRLGFQSLPHLDALTPICERPDAVVSLFGEVEAEDTLFVDAHDEREANRIAEILADNLGARPFG